MTLAADTRAAVRREPFLHEALRTGVVNYTAAARFLGIGETDAVVAALRRYAEALPERERGSRRVRVTMQSGLGMDGEAPLGEAEPLLSVGGSTLLPDAGSLTAVLATGDVDAAALAHALARLGVEDVRVEAAGVAGDALLVVTDRRGGPEAIRVVEDSLSEVPASTPSPTD